LTTHEENSTDLLVPDTSNVTQNEGKEPPQPTTTNTAETSSIKSTHSNKSTHTDNAIENTAVVAEPVAPTTDTLSHPTTSNDTIGSNKSPVPDVPLSPHQSNTLVHDNQASDDMKSPLVEDVSQEIPTPNYNRFSYQAIYADHSDFDNYKLETVVSSPIKDVDGNSKSYISYLLTTTTNNPKLLKLSQKVLDDKNELVTIQTRRRYGDFRYLHDSLSKDYPTIMIPPLPSKSNFKYLTGDTFSSEFVHKRLNSLNRFVKFIISHKILSQASIYHLFISDSVDWATFTKSLKIKDNEDSNNGFVNKVVNEEFTETFMNLLTPSKHKRETNKDILEINDKLKKLYENLLKLDKLFIRLNKKNHDLSVDYDHFSNQVTKLALVHKEDSQVAASDNANTDTKTTDDAIVNNFKIFAESLTYFLKNWETMHKYIDETFLVSLKDCSRYIVSLTNLIELEHNNKIDLQVLQDYLAKSKNELAILGDGDHRRSPPVPVSYNNSGIVNTTTQLIKDTLSTSATPNLGSATTDNKIEKLQKKISQLEQEIESQTNLVNDLTSNIINEEYPDWDKFNRIELKNSMLGLCDEQIKFYRGLIDNWSEVELKLMKRLDELN
jgi:sorting nexin-4